MGARNLREGAVGVVVPSRSVTAWPAVDRRVRSLLPSESWRKVRALHVVRPWRSVRCYAQTYAAIVAIIAVAAYARHWFVTALAIVLIAGRQHALYVLNHDASHHGLFGNAAANKWVATALSVFPMLHHPEAWSYVQWRRVHVLHHRYLFTARDPNYVGRELRGDTTRRYTPATLALACLRAGATTWLEFFRGRQDYVDPKFRGHVKGRDNHLRALLLPFADDAEMERERRLKCVVFAVALALITYLHAWPMVGLFWILPMYTVYPMILTLMDLTEHRWTEEGDDLNRIARSTRLGWKSHVLMTFLPRTLHREHHAFPGVCASDLPILSRLLVDAKVTPEPMRGLGSLLRDLNRSCEFLLFEGKDQRNEEDVSQRA